MIRRVILLPCHFLLRTRYPRVAPSRTWKPICRFGGAGGSISSRMASKTTLNWASYLFSSAASLRASSVFERSISRKRTNVRMIAMLPCTARGLRRTLESIATPCEPHKLEIRNAKGKRKVIGDESKRAAE